YGANKLTQHRGLAPDAELVAVSADLGRAFALSHVRLSGSFKSNSRPTASALLKSGFSFWLTSRSIGHRTGLICPPSRNGVCMAEAGDQPCSETRLRKHERPDVRACFGRPRACWPKRWAAA